MLDELVNKAINGDKEAFTNAILSIEKDLYTIAKIKLKNDDDVCEAVQETMISTYNNIKKLKKTEYFKTWVIRILINECNKIYASKRKSYVSLDEMTNLKDDLDMNNSILEKIDFNSLIQSLKNDEKTIITLYYYLKYTTKEISTILKINESTVRSKILRSKQKLYKKFIKEGEKNG